MIPKINAGNLERGEGREEMICGNIASDASRDNTILVVTIQFLFENRRFIPHPYCMYGSLWIYSVIRTSGGRLFQRHSPQAKGS